MRIYYEYRKITWKGTKYNVNDETDMRVFISDLKTEFKKIESENKLLRCKIDNIKELLEV